MGLLLSLCPDLRAVKAGTGSRKAPLTRSKLAEACLVFAGMFNSGSGGTTVSHIAFYGPRVLIVAHMTLSAAYLVSGDPKRALYWFGASIITVAITI